MYVCKNLYVHGALVLGFSFSFRESSTSTGLAEFEVKDGGKIMVIDYSCTPVIQLTYRGERNTATAYYLEMIFSLALFDLLTLDFSSRIITINDHFTLNLKNCTWGLLGLM